MAEYYMRVIKGSKQGKWDAFITADNESEAIAKSIEKCSDEFIGYLFIKKNALLLSDEIFVFVNKAENEVA